MKKRTYILLPLVIGLCSGILSGCGAKKESVVVIERTPYEKVTYRTTTVQQGDLEPSIVLKIKAEGYKKINYTMQESDLEVDEVLVSVGDKVKEGDLLVSFQSEELKDRIESYSEQMSQNELLIEHYTNLMNIDPDADYKNDIEMLKQDDVVAQLYIDEAKKQLAEYQIVATASGTVTYVSDVLANGSYSPGSNLITLACGTGNYSTTTTDNYEFQIGDVYTAVCGLISYDLQISDIAEQTDSNGNVSRTLTFQPLSDMSGVSDADTLSMTIEKPAITQAIYVQASAVHESEDGYFVYVVDEDGYRDVVRVEIGEQVNDDLVITSGLTAGEKVSLN